MPPPRPKRQSFGPGSVIPVRGWADRCSGVRAGVEEDDDGGLGEGVTADWRTSLFSLARSPPCPLSSFSGMGDMMESIERLQIE